MAVRLPTGESLSMQTFSYRPGIGRNSLLSMRRWESDTRSPLPANRSFLVQLCFHSRLGCEGRIADSFTAVRADW